MKNWTPFNIQSEKSLRLFAHAEFGLRLDKIRTCSPGDPLRKSLLFVDVDTNRCVHAAENIQDAAVFMLDEFNRRQSKGRERHHEMMKRSQRVLDRAARIVMGTKTPSSRAN